MLIRDLRKKNWIGSDYEYTSKNLQTPYVHACSQCALATRTKERHRRQIRNNRDRKMIFLLGKPELLR